MIERQRVPLRQRRDLGQIFSDAITLYGQNLAPLFVIAATVVPVGIAAAVFQAAGDDIALQAIAVAVLVLDLLVNILATVALLVALADIDAGQTPTFARAYDVAFERGPVLLRALLRVAFHVFLFAITIVGLPWAVQRSIRWLFVEQAVVLEGAAPKESLSVSAAAVEGSWWRTAGVWLAVVFGVAVPTTLINAIFFLAPVLVSGTVSSLLNALALPFTTAALTLLYFDLKERKESDDLASPAGSAAPQP